MDIDGFDGVESEYHRLRADVAGVKIGDGGGAAGEEGGSDGVNLAKMDGMVGLPASCDPPGPNNPPKQLVWIIFGATGHIGRSLARCALNHGDLVVAVGQTHINTLSSVTSWHTNCLGTLCDVRSRPTISAVYAKALSHFGRYDIIANCSGVAIIGAAEDQDEAEIRNQMEVNFMGTLHILQLSLPYFREREEGRYLVFSSVSGALGVPGLAPYCASKYATEGLVEALLYEVDAFNIKATLIEPGLLRRDDSSPPHLSPSVAQTPGVPTSSSTTRLNLYGHFQVKTPSPPYADATSPAGHYKRMALWLGDRQPTSVVKSAELCWGVAHCRYPPLRFLLGSWAVESVRDRVRWVVEEGEEWRGVNWPGEEGEEEGKEEDDGKVEVERDGDEMEGIEEEDGREREREKS